MIKTLLVSMLVFSILAIASSDLAMATPCKEKGYNSIGETTTTDTVGTLQCGPEESPWTCEFITKVVTSGPRKCRLTGEIVEEGGEEAVVAFYTVTTSKTECGTVDDPCPLVAAPAVEKETTVCKPCD